MKIQLITQASPSLSRLFIIDDSSDWDLLPLTSQHISYIGACVDKKQHLITFNEFGTITMVLFLQKEDATYRTDENCRQKGMTVINTLNQHKVEEVLIENLSNLPHASLLLAEGISLGNYQFLKYKQEAANLRHSLQTISILESDAGANKVAELQTIIEAVYIARNLVNEPLSYLTAPQISQEIAICSQAAGFKHTLFDKKRIEEEKMGGLLAVNKGSVDPPTFNILEWKPENAVNEQPIVLVGKGIVYDTGGLSLKSTTNSMDHMKCDMGGAAAVIGALYAVSKNKLPLYVVGLVPATDNRPGGNAYAPGDVIKMRSGHTVEVLNTDAEGRMILADGLDYAKSYNPSLVIDIATLTGGALMTIAQEGMLLFSNASSEDTKTISEVGFQVFERLWEMPLWSEFSDKLKSNIADFKNVGGRQASSITAAKFLQNFTDFPWMHIDMASMGWMYQGQGYRLKQGSGAGVRLFYHFFTAKLNHYLNNSDTGQTSGVQAIETI